jgi:hypothetical protein
MACKIIGRDQRYYLAVRFQVAPRVDKHGGSIKDKFKQASQ